MIPSHLERPVLKLTFGNMKLPKTTAIFNVCGAHECPSDILGLCTLGLSGNKKCYALKGYRNMAGHRSFYNAQRDYWKVCTPASFVADFLREAQKEKELVRYLRFNETGDFFDESCVSKVEKIAALLFPDIIVYGYTHRRDLPWSRCRYFVVNASSEENGTEDWSGELNGFRAVEKPSGEAFVCPGDCTVCHRCAIKHGRTTEVVMH